VGREEGILQRRRERWEGEPAWTKLDFKYAGTNSDPSGELFWGVWIRRRGDGSKALEGLKVLERGREEDGCYEGREKEGSSKQTKPSSRKLARLPPSLEHPSTQTMSTQLSEQDISALGDLTVFDQTGAKVRIGTLWEQERTLVIWIRCVPSFLSTSSASLLRTSLTFILL